MNLKQLEAFVQVAEKKNFSRAAKAMYIVKSIPIRLILKKLRK